MRSKAAIISGSNPKILTSKILASTQMIDSQSAATRTRVLSLLALVFLSRLMVAIVIWAMNGPSGFWLPDTPSYLAPAESLLHGSFSIQGVPELVRTPGYPLLLIPAVAVHHPVLVGIFENCLLAAISAWLLWKITSELAPGSKAAFYAVVLYCAEAVGLIYSEKLLSETLFATQLLCFVWLTLRFLRSPNLRNLLSSAFLLGLATYTRPVSLFLGLCLAPFFLLFPRPLSWGRRCAQTIIFVLAFMITLAPWVIRNVAVADYRGFSAITDVNLYFYSEAAIQAKLEHKTYLQAQNELGYGGSGAYFRVHPEQSNWPAAQVLQFQRAEARKTISEHWLLYAMIHLRGCVIVLLDPAATEFMKVLRMYPESGGLIYRATDQGVMKAALWLVRRYPAAGIILFLLGLQLLLYYALGFMGLRRLPLPASILFILLFAYFVLVSGSSYADARFRTPIMPLLCVAGAVDIAERQASRRRSDTRASTQVQGLDSSV